VVAGNLFFPLGIKTTLQVTLVEIGLISLRIVYVVASQFISLYTGLARRLAIDVKIDNVPTHVTIFCLRLKVLGGSKRETPNLSIVVLVTTTMK